MAHLEELPGERAHGRQTDRQAWNEAISLFSTAHRGDQLAGRIVLDTATELRLLIEMSLQLLQVHLMDTEDSSVSRFLTAAASAGPPPRYGIRPMPRQRPKSAS